MKKLICLLMLLWLPLFMGSAWAMSTQMQASNLMAGMSDMPCHDMDGEQLSDSELCKKCSMHSCFACGLCACATLLANCFISSEASIAPAMTMAGIQSNQTSPSQLYPPALRPPISA